MSVSSRMYSADDIQYALEATEILLEPDRRIDTFGSTSFEFHLISELMDTVGETRVREGVLHADRPTIIRPEAYAELAFEGFGEQAQAFSEWLRDNANDLSILTSETGRLCRFDSDEWPVPKSSTELRIPSSRRRPSTLWARIGSSITCVSVSSMVM